MNREQTIQHLINLGIAQDKAENLNLREANLREADLRGADLRGTDLRGADLREANLREADLRGANLWGTDLRGTDLWGTDLRGADLKEANLKEANLRGADLRGAENSPLTMSLAEYISKFRVRVQGNKLELFKFFEVKHDKTLSPFQGAEYDLSELPKVIKEKAYDANIFSECGAGINLATESWCRERMENRGETMLVRCLVHWKDIISVPIYTDGKIRAKKVTLIEIVSKEE